MLCSIPYVTLRTWKRKVSNFGFARQTNTDTKSLQFWLQSWHKKFSMLASMLYKNKTKKQTNKKNKIKKQTNKQTNNDISILQCWVCMTNHHWHQSFNIELYYQILASKKKTANTDISCWIQSHYILVFKVGLHDKPTLTLKFQCWPQCSTTKHKSTMTFQVHFQYWAQSHITIHTWKDTCPTLDSTLTPKFFNTGSVLYWNRYSLQNLCKKPSYIKNKPLYLYMFTGATFFVTEHIHCSNSSVLHRWLLSALHNIFTFLHKCTSFNSQLLHALHNYKRSLLSTANSSQL